MRRSHAILVAGLGLAVLLLAAQAAGNSPGDKPTARWASVLTEPYVPGVLAAGPQIELTLYMVSADDGTPDSATPGTERVSFHPGETVRVTLCASNTGPGAEITAVCNVRDHAQTAIDYVCYDSHDPRKTPSGAVEDSTQYVPSDGVRYFSFDYVLPKWAPGGAYDVAGAARNPADWDELWDTTAPGPADEDWGDAWLNGESSVTPVHAVSVPILMYHQIEAPLESPSWVTPETFDQQMAALAAYGYTCVTVDEIMRYRAGTSSPPANPVLLTFDDGYKNHLTNALPVLQDHGLSGTFFIITGVTEESMPASEDKLIWPEVQALKSAGMEIGSHTVTHPRLTAVGDAQLEAEVRDSMADIEAHLGVGTCTAFAYPFGDGHDDQRVEAAVRDAKYHGALAAKGGIDNTASCNPFALKRMGIREEHSVNLDNESPDHFFMKKVDPDFPIPDVVVDSISFEDTNGAARGSFALQETVVIKVSARNLGDPVDVIGSLEIDNDLDPDTPSEYDSHPGGDILVTAFGLASRSFEYSWTIPPDASMGQYYCVFGVHDINYVLGFEHTAWQAAFEVVESHTLTVCSAPVTGITISGVPGGTTDYAVQASDGTQVSLTAPETFADGQTDYGFVRWALNGDDLPDDPPEGERTAAFTMSEDTTALAQYEAIERTLHVQSVPITGVLIEGDPAECGGQTNHTVQLDDNTEVSLTAPLSWEDGGVHYEFERWRLGGVDQPEGETVLTFHIHDDPTTAVAIYGAVQRTLNVESQPVTGVLIGGDPAECGGQTNYTVFVDDGTQVSLTAPETFAEEETDYKFVRWTLNGDDPPDDPPEGQRTASFMASQDTTAVAQYQVTQRTLQVQSVPITGVLIEGDPAECGGAANYTVGLDDNTEVSLTASLSWEDGGVHYEFVRWRLGGVDKPEGETTLTIWINDDPTTAVVVYWPMPIEHGVVWAGSSWNTVQLTLPFTDPIVLAGPATSIGWQPGVVRLRNVTASSFEVRFQEWDYLDGWHVAERIHWLAVERGAHELADGKRLVADKFDTACWNVLAPEWVAFPEAFTGAPVVLAQVQTFNGAEAVTDRICSVQADGMLFSMQEQEAGGWHCAETVGYVALQEGVQDIAGIPCEVRRTAAVVTHKPFILVGSEGQCLVRVEEEQSADGETQHPAAEAVGFLSLAGEPPLVADMQTRNDPDPCTLRVRVLAQGFQAEEGIAEIDHRWRRVNLGGTYRDPVVLAGPASYAGVHPGVVRVKGVTPTSFELRFQEWDYLDGWHCREKVHWMVAERGVWDVGGGRLWILDESPLSNANVFAPTQVNLPLTLGSADVVLATQQTAVGAAAVTERLSQIGPAGFRVSIQEEEAADAWHVEETLGFLVIGTGAGGLAALAPEVTVGTGAPAGWQLSVVEEQSKNQETWHPAEQTGCVAFGGYADEELHFLAAMQSCNGIDPCSLRARRLEAACVVLGARDEEGNVLAGVPVAVSGALGPAGVIATGLRPVQCAQELGRALTVTAPPSLFDGGRAFAFSHWEVDGQPAKLGRTTVELNVPQAGRAVAIYVAVQ